MADEPIVQLTSAPGVQAQFGRGRFAYQNAGHSSVKIAASSCAVLAVGIFAVVLTGSPKRNRSDVTSHFLGVALPVVQPSIRILQIPRVGANPNPKPSGAVRPKVAVRLFGPELVARPRNITIPPGSIAEAQLITGGSDGPVRAELKEPLVVAGETLLETGTVLVGTGQSGEDRLAVHFTKAVFSDGSVAKISAQAADASDKIAGLKGSRIGYRATQLAAAVGLQFVGGLSQGLEDSQGEYGAVVTPPSMKNALLNGAARASIQQGQDMMTEYRNQKPVIEVPQGTVIVVLFDDSTS